MSWPAFIPQLIFIGIIAALQAIQGELQSISDADAYAAAIVIGALLKIIEVYWGKPVYALRGGEEPSRWRRFWLG